MAMKTTLLKRKALSRLRNESRRFSALSFGSRQARSDSDTVTTTQRKPENHGPIPDRAKEWTDAMTPLLVMKVPKIERQKAMRTRTMFQTFNIPFFSWIITEWM